MIEKNYLFKIKLCMSGFIELLIENLNCKLSKRQNRGSNIVYKHFLKYIFRLKL